MFSFNNHASGLPLREVAVEPLSVSTAEAERAGKHRLVLAIVVDRVEAIVLDFETSTTARLGWQLHGQSGCHFQVWQYRTPRPRSEKPARGRIPGSRRPAFPGWFGRAFNQMGVSDAALVHAGLADGDSRAPARKRRTSTRCRGLATGFWRKWRTARPSEIKKIRTVCRRAGERGRQPMLDRDARWHRERR